MLFINFKFIKTINYEKFISNNLVGSVADCLPIKKGRQIR